MAGIVCATGREDVVPRVMLGLGSLVEHLGCDSAGLGALVDRRIQRRRVAGPLSGLTQLLSDEPLVASTVIGHVRRATHGESSRRNAHPHASSRVAVVHTGVIENYQELRAELERDGAQFRSDTDSEAIVWLLDQELANRAHPMRALRGVLSRLEGDYAMAAIFTQFQHRVFAARRGIPLVAGRSDDDASCLATDADAIRAFVRESVDIDDGHIAELRRGRIRIFDGDLRPQTPRWPRHITEREVSGTQVLASVTDAHISAQPKAVGELLRRLREDLTLGRAEAWCGPLGHAERILAVGEGPSYPLAHVAQRWFEAVLGVPVELELISEIEARQTDWGRETVALVVPHADDEEAISGIRYLKKKGVRTVALASSSSALGREADGILDAHARGLDPTGSPLGVRLATLAAASVAARSLRTGEREPDGAGRSIFAVPRAMETALELSDQCATRGREIAQCGHAVYLGRGLSHPTACLGAEELRAQAEVPASAFAGGELGYRLSKASENPNCAVVVAPTDGTLGKTLLDARALVEKGVRPLLLGDSDSLRAGPSEELDWITVDRVHRIWSPLSLCIPLQLLAFHATRARKWIAERTLLSEQLATAR